jgi:hypothetical protein
MSALARDLGRVFVVFAVGAAVFLVGHARTGGVSAFLLISHEAISPSGMPDWAILELGCDFGGCEWLV